MEAAVAAQTGNSDSNTVHTINEKGAVPLVLGDEESIVDVLKTRSFLVGQKHDLSIALAADQTVVDEDNDVEKLQKRISELQRELLKVSADLSIKEIVLRKMQCGQALSDRLFDEPLPSSDTTVKNGSLAVSGEERRKFEALIQEQSSLSNTILRKHERVEELQKELDNVRKQNFELKKKNRSFMEIITQQHKRLETAMEDVKSSPACLGLKEELENTMARVNIAKCTLQALIVGSGVNWAQDSELAETVFLCGQSLNL